MSQVSSVQSHVAWLTIKSNVFVNVGYGDLPILPSLIMSFMLCVAILVSSDVVAVSLSVLVAPLTISVKVMKV